MPRPVDAVVEKEDHAEQREEGRRGAHEQAQVPEDVGMNRAVLRVFRERDDVENDAADEQAEGAGGLVGERPRGIDRAFATLAGAQFVSVRQIRVDGVLGRPQYRQRRCADEDHRDVDHENHR